MDDRKRTTSTSCHRVPEKTLLAMVAYHRKTVINDCHGVSHNKIIVTVSTRRHILT